MNNIATRSSRTRHILQTLALSGLTAGALVFAALESARTVSAGPDRLAPFRPETALAGSWVMTIGAPPGPVFTALETFTESGGSVETNNGPTGAPANPGSAIGSWVYMGRRQYLATLWRQNFDAAGNYAGTIKVRRLITVSLNGDDFTGRDNVDLFDPAGNRLPVEIPPSSFTGRRLAPEAINR